MRQFHRLAVHAVQDQVRLPHITLRITVCTADRLHAINRTLRHCHICNLADERRSDQVPLVIILIIIAVITRQNVPCRIFELFRRENAVVDQLFRHTAVAFIAIFRIVRTEQPRRERNRISADKALLVRLPYLIVIDKSRTLIAVRIQMCPGQKNAILAAGDIALRAVQCRGNALGQTILIQPADVFVRPLRHIGKRMLPVSCQRGLFCAKQTGQHHRGLCAGHGFLQRKALVGAFEQSKIIKHLRLRFGIAGIVVVDRTDLCRTGGTSQQTCHQTRGNKFFHVAPSLHT